MASAPVADVSEGDTLATRLQRLGAAYIRSRQAAQDDRVPLVAAVYEADQAGWTGKKIAAATGLSRSWALSVIEQAATAAPTVEAS